MVYIDQVLDEFDHGKEDGGVTHPIEHVIDIRAVFTLEFLYPSMVRGRGEDYERQ